VAERPRAFVRVAGTDAEDYLQRMLSNDVAVLEPGGSCDALLLTAKARVIAPVRVLRRSADDFLLLTEPELGERVRHELSRLRFAAKAEIEPEQHRSVVVFGDGDGIPTDDYGETAREVLDADLEPTIDEDELERLRVTAGTPRWGREIDDRVLPAEAGLVDRLHYRGHANRRLRVLEIEGDPPEPDTEIRLGEKVVGRVTSAVPGKALGYVRTEVPDDAELTVGSATARLH
jgi:folate-binding Fe-S cluster repair protein YgfZ